MPHRGAQYNFNIAQSVNTQILGPNTDRDYVIISSPASDSIIVSIGVPITSANLGFRLYHGQTQLEFRREDIGSLIEQPFYAWGTNAGGNVFSVIEGMK